MSAVVAAIVDRGHAAGVTDPGYSMLFKPFIESLVCVMRQ